MAYQRFLRNSDYYRIITKQHFEDTVRKQYNKANQAEQAAEVSVIENLIENYEIEETLSIGKRIVEYNRQISYPEGAYFWATEDPLDVGKIVEPYRTIRPIKCAQRPYLTPYWAEIEHDTPEEVDLYSQFKDYNVGELLNYKGFIFQCLKKHGYSYNDIRQPITQYQSKAWQYIESNDWVAEAVEVGGAVYLKGDFYVLISEVDIDFALTPTNGVNWLKVKPYVFENNAYLVGDYVNYEGNLYKAVTNPNSDIVTEGVNIIERDPRNFNLVKHMTRISLYELSKNLAPNMVSQTKVQDYLDSMQWLRDCNKCKINPTIPRKKDEQGNENTDWAFAGFSKGYNPYENPFQT